MLVEYVVSRKPAVSEGFTSGKLTAISIHSKSRNGHLRWLCRCECGRTHDVLSTHLVQQKVTHCGCDPYRGRSHRQWTGHGEISGNKWDSIKRGADGSKGRRVIEFSITIEYAWSLFLKQKRLCALSGLQICFEHTTTQTTNSCTASLDRIDSSVGYVEGNVQWLHKDINRMKNSFNQDYFVELCQNVSKCKGGVCEI